MVKGSCYDDDESDFYGELVDVVELEYFGNGNRVALFQCNWFDTRRGVKIDRHGIVDVNCNLTLNSYEPFVLATQATQVLYVSSVSKKSGDWYTVIKTKARNTYEMPSDDKDEDDAAPTVEETYQEDDAPYVQQNYGVDNDLDNISLHVAGPVEEVDPKDLIVPANKKGKGEDEDEDEEQEADEEDEDEDEESDCSNSVDD